MSGQEIHNFLFFSVSVFKLNICIYDIADRSNPLLKGFSRTMAFKQFYSAAFKKLVKSPYLMGHGACLLFLPFSYFSKFELDHNGTS